jgi:hypothetical protein
MMPAIVMVSALHISEVPNILENPKLGGSSDKYTGTQLIHPIEQPDAPKSDGNTAPQEPTIGSKQQSFEEAALKSAKVPASNVPIIGGKPQSFEEDALTSAKVPTSTVPIVGGKTQSFEEAAVTSDPSPKATTIDTKDTSPSAAAAATSNSTAQPLSSGFTEVNKESSTSNKEQRSSSKSEGESSEPPRQAAHADASIEALEGPQGPPPKTAEEFEKESKGKKPAAATDDVEKSKLFSPFFLVYVYGTDIF